MNERIEELAEKATQEFSSAFERDKWLEKFAELIVKDCLCIVENNNPRPPGTTIMYSLDKDEYFDTGWQVSVETKSYQIKKHFGVEE